MTRKLNYGYLNEYTNLSQFLLQKPVNYIIDIILKLYLWRLLVAKVHEGISIKLANVPKESDISLVTHHAKIAQFANIRVEPSSLTPHQNLNFEKVSYAIIYTLFDMKINEFL